MPLRIEPATSADVPDILALIRALAQYEKLSHEVVATEEQLRATLFGARPVAEVLMARFDARVVGFALYFHNYSTFLAKPGIYIEDIFVIPECRGAGVGRALLAAVAAIAVERDCGRLEWAVLDWNAPAIGFYRKLGARAMDEWTAMRVSGLDLKRLAAATKLIA